jgi:hypothetical protein
MDCQRGGEDRQGVKLTGCEDGLDLPFATLLCRIVCAPMKGVGTKRPPHGVASTWGTANAVDAYGDLILSHQAACVTAHSAQAAFLFLARKQRRATY